MADKPSGTPHGSRAQINEFLQQKRIAVVGVSRNPGDFTRKLYDEFQRRGYDLVPVNPAITELAGAKCYSSVRDVQPVSAVLLLTAPEISERVAEDCIAAGVRHVWMYRAMGQGAVSSKAVQLCRQQGINVIAGECPFMFFPDAGFIHRVHGWISRIAGSYPA